MPINPINQKISLDLLEQLKHNIPMNRLSREKQAQVVAALMEGNSINSTVRMVGVHKTTILKLLRNLGIAAADYQDRTLVNLKCKRIQVDEIWSFVYAKEKNCPVEQKKKGAGDVWTWVALDPDTKLVPCWFIGQGMRVARTISFTT